MNNLVPNEQRNEFKITIGQHSFLGRCTFAVIQKIEQRESLFALSGSCAMGEVKVSTCISVLHECIKAYDGNEEFELPEYDEFGNMVVEAGAAAALTAMKDFLIIALAGIPKEGKVRRPQTKLKEIGKQS